MRRAELRPAARDDLIKIWESGAERWGEDAADRYIRDLVAELGKAASAPLRGSERNWVVPGLCKWNVRNHHAYFLVIEIGIDVIRILHPSMDVQSAISS